MRIDLDSQLERSGIEPDHCVLTQHQGRTALWLDTGLVTVRELDLGDLEASVDVCFTQRLGYAGIAFRGGDRDNYELCYVSPIRGAEAVQYDPVFGGSNTWQVYCGADHLAPAHVPHHRWVTLTVRAVGDRASFSVDGEEVLRIHQLKHGRPTGFLGLWCYKPCYFSRFRVRGVNGGRDGTEPIRRWEISPKFPDDQEMSATVEPCGWKAVEAEPDGVVCLNRYYAKGPGCESVYARTVIHALQARRVRMTLGFSDGCTMWLNDRELFRGTNFWGEADSGRLSWNPAHLRASLKPGPNHLRLKVMEQDRFGWGFRLEIADPECQLTVCL